MTDDVIAYFGTVAVLKIQRTAMTVSINNQIVEIPREPFCDDNGIWGTAYDLTNATFVSTDACIPDELRQTIKENIALVHTEIPYIFE